MDIRLKELLDIHGMGCGSNNRRFICKSARTGKTLLSNTNKQEYKNMFLNRYVRSIFTDIVMDGDAAYARLVIFIADPF